MDKLVKDEMRSIYKAMPLFLLLFLPVAHAGTMGEMNKSAFRPIFTLTGGITRLHNNSNTQTFYGDDDIMFIYHSPQNKNKGLSGIFAGIEHPFFTSGFFWQGGVEWIYRYKNSRSGAHEVGNDPDSYTPYHWHNQINSQQILATGKLLSTAYERVHPYVLGSIGAAINKTSGYNTTTTQTGSINLSPYFSGSNNTSFSYGLGIGLDVDINENFRIGGGYRYSGLGKISSGNGAIIFNQYVYPVNFTLGARHLYANDFVLQLSYLV